MLPIALNHMTMARAGVDDLLAAAASLGAVGVELRNDLPGNPFGGVEPQVLREMLDAHGLRLLGMSEVKAFNDWNADTVARTRALIKEARQRGSESISLIPRCDGYGTEAGERRENLDRALGEVLPLLEGADMVALVEPLGFAHSSLRFKEEAIEAIDRADGHARLKLVHDTFHHYLAGETQFFAAQTGIVHISGVDDHDLAMGDIGDEHRVLVGAGDRLGNVDQIRTLTARGYEGALSFEAFSPEIHALQEPLAALEASVTWLRVALTERNSIPA